MLSPKATDKRRLMDRLTSAADIAAGLLTRHKAGGISLVLHDVGATGGADSASLDQFLEWVQAWTQDVCRTFVRHPWPVPDNKQRWNHLSFDDAYEDALRLAAPILAARRIPFAFAVSADLIGGVADWHGGSGRRIADAALIKETVASGGVLLSHGLKHEDFHRLTLKEFAVVARRSREELEQRFSTAVEGFVFPYGHSSKFAVNILEESGYRYGLTAVPGLITRRSIAQLLPRCGLNYLMPARQTSAIADGGSIWRSLYLEKRFIKN
ncbi:MAG: polysaccharide deacetylase family protein [Pyrinomonadaceae bacterium]